MEYDELQKRVRETASEAVGVAKGVVDKVRDVAEQAITKENAELLKQDVVKQANAAKEFVKKTFTRENAEHARKAVCEGVDKLRTAEGREEVKAKMVAKASVAKSRIVGIWNSGTKGKCLCDMKCKLIVALGLVAGAAFATGRAYYCQHCGFKAGSIQSLTSGKCLRHPGGTFAGPHVLYEGSEKKEYLCKYCGHKSGDLRSLTSGKCLRHPNGAFKGYHAPAL